MLSIVIPSRTDTYLQQTCDGLLAMAHGEIEIIVVTDGYTPRFHPNIVTRVIPLPRVGMRACINAGMAAARCDYVMKLDEHCLVADGFDVALMESCAPTWLVVPRRYRLDPDAWAVIDDGRPPVDYMYIAREDGRIKGKLWNRRHYERKDIPVDDLMTFQGSCYFCRRDYWMDLLHPLDDANYGPFANEAQEIGLKVWLSGGRVVVNKHTWYAHWHRNTGYNFTHEEQREFNEAVRKGREYSADYWLNNRWEDRVHDYEWLEQKFGIRQGVPA